ncbi:MmgE/PrpD family protein [Chelativorans sp. AA-79]|uniref:MmgE/PrpD family protein n=1 Tax=Chelativorans sp. AA-79 TaxID=3028735 RepID=UPI0023F9396E|nr:MmgE/PrpD family protein [Chelativorans sp. AA-79]WEX08052.1 MmgE/PrpD family protein [Chelativorans sp. AA-79]
MHVTKEMADYIVGSRFEDLPEDVVAEARRAIVNIVGCAMGGAPEEGTDIAIATFSPFFGKPTAAIVGRREKADPLHAALMNGITSHFHDYDDTTPKNYIHASSPVASALFAYASANPVSGRDFLHAFILGFEVTSRVGNATYPAHYDAGWHSTGTCGVFGAAVAIGKLLGLDSGQMIHAIGLAATQAAGLREMFGSMGKPFHPGRAAQNGYVAALLAQNGFTSGIHPLEGPRGFAAVQSASYDLSKLTDGLGRDFDLRENTYKPFPCGIVNHPAIDAAIQLHHEHRLAPGSVKAVRLRVAPLVMDLCGKRDITKGLQGKFSVVHGAAVGLVRGKAGLQEYTDEAVNDPEIRRVRESAVAEGDAAISEDGVAMTVEFQDGRVLTKTLTHSLGNLARPLSNAQLEEKFRDQACRLLSAEDVERLLGQCWAIAELPSAGALVDASVPGEA